MPNGTSAAVTEATRLDEIRFPEFTAKLVTDTFDALVAANVRQTESYLELVQTLAKSVGQYITDTQDDIGGDEILEFLVAVLPPDAPDSSATTKAVEGATLTSDDVTKLDAAVALPAEAGVANNNATGVSSGSALDAAAVQAITSAVARRIALNKYEMLQGLVRQGLLRLVVEQGVIETRLTFTTYGSSFYQRNATQYNRSEFNLRARAATGWGLSKWIRASASTAYTSVGVRTAQETHRDVSGSNVQIFGRVEIRFKTDFLPLNA
jgi:hypothetical protein